MSELDLDFPGFERLDDLDLPPLLPGDQWYPAPEGVHFFDPDGKALPGDIIAQAYAFEEFRLNGDNHFHDSLWFNDIPFEVSTVYLGVNHTFRLLRDLPSQPPIIWETMIFPGLNRLDTWLWRYSSRNAAKAAHATILDTLLDMGFTRADGETVTIAGGVR